MYNGPKYEAPIRVTIVLSETGFDISIEPSDTEPCIRGDIDNYAKTILDALNKVAWSDDSIVQELRVIK